MQRDILAQAAEADDEGTASLMSERGTTDSIIDSNNITYNKVLVEYHIYNNITLDAEVGGENPGADLFYNFNF